MTLQVFKDAANRHGLSALLAKPSENHLHQQQPQLARFPATSNPSLLSHQHPPISSSTMPLKTTSSHERLLTHTNGHGHHHHPQSQQQQQQQQHFATLAHPPHHQMAPPALTQPRPASRTQLPNTSSSYEFVYNAKSVPINNNNNHHQQQQPQQRYSQQETSHRLIQPARSAQALIDEETTEELLNDHTIQHQSNPNLFHSNPNPYPMSNNRNQTFDLPKRSYTHDNHPYNGNDHHDLYEQEYNGEEVDEEEEEEEDLQPSNFVRSASERQSFGDRNLSTAPPLVYREDVPPNQNGYTNGNHQVKPINHTQSAIGPAIAPKPLPKPMISALALIKQTNAVNSLFPNNQNDFVFFSF